MKGTIETDLETVTFYAREERIASKLKASSHTSKDGSITENYVGRIYLPKEWIGKRVMCLLLDDPAEPDAPGTEK